MDSGAASGYNRCSVYRLSFPPTSGTILDSSNPQDEPKQLGDFDIIRELGRGGMGVVYEARQRSLNRRVALKVLSTGLGLTTKAIMRFKREAEAAAKLHHTNIVPIYFTGDEGRVPYYAMELVDGPSLDHVIRQLRGESNLASNGSLDSTDAASSGQQSAIPDWVSATIGFERPSSDSDSTPSTSVNSDSSSSFGSGSTYFDTVAEMMSGVADALAHAHDHGVIHRDIKPSNMLLSQDGRLSVNDFGLARMLEQPGMTISGELMGSPMYMSPEQIAVGRIPLDHRTDIYSLGASLYQLLTLQTPFDGQQRDQVLSQIIHKEPAAPRSINKQIPQDLETICLKAMEKDPDRRYQTADQMAEDLRSFVKRHAISARRIGPMERATRWARKNKALTAMACLTLVVGISATVYVYSLRVEQFKQEERQREEAMLEAKENALMAALGGNLTEAETQIDLAMALGADEAWNFMLAGRVSLFKGKSKEALDSLKKAVKGDPGSVMAQSMLAEAYLANGEFGAYMETIETVNDLPTDKPEDHLFKGWAIRVFEPQEAIVEISEAIQTGRGFTLARVLRAEVEVFLAQDQADLAKAESAIRDLESLSRDLKESPLLTDTRLGAQLVAYRMRQSKGEFGLAQKNLDKARAFAEQLASSPGFFFANHHRLLYYEFSKELDVMQQVMQKAVDESNTGFIVDPYAAAFYRAGGTRIDEALSLLAQMDQRDPYVTIATCILRMEDPATRDNAQETFREFIQKIPSNSLNVHDVTFRFFLLGEDEGQSFTYAQKRTKGIRETESEYLAYFHDLAEYKSGHLSKEELIARAGESERDLHMAHFNIALVELAKDHRPRAKEYFEKCANSPLFNWTGSIWSRAFLARIDDPNWASWLRTVEPVSDEPQ